MNQKGMELSINTLVVLILGIILLIGSLTLVYKIVIESDQVIDTHNQQIEQQLLEKIVKDDLKVAVFENIKTVHREEMAVYAVAFQNHLNGLEHSFIVEVVPETMGCLDIASVCPKPEFIDETYTLKRYDSKAVYIGLDVLKETTPGEYIYNVNVNDKDTGDLYGRTKIHVIVK